MDLFYLCVTTSLEFDRMGIDNRFMKLAAETVERDCICFLILHFDIL